MNRHTHTLELDKIGELLAAETSCADTGELARKLEPCSVLPEVRLRLKETGDAHMLMARFGSPSFGQAKNVTSALRRADSGASLSLRELLDIAETLRIIRSLSEWRSHCVGVSTSLDSRFSILAPNRYLEDRITSCVLNDTDIADNASSELANIRRKIRAASLRVRDQLDKMIHSQTYQKLLQDPIVTIRDGRFVVPVRAEHRSEIPGLVHDTSSSGATVFVEPMGVVEANNEIRVLQSKEEAEIERIISALSAEAGSFAQSIIDDYNVLIELDFVFAKAKLAYKMKASMPEVSDDHHILLRHARHPLIDSKKVVPIDVELGAAFDTLVITGPNTGGKTVTLKTLGLLTLMVMCGLMPPVDDGSHFSVFDQVLADIGDEQSIEQSLSTFSSHVVNQIEILQKADSSSLVLLDELGAGTDPVEGAALAVSILEQLRMQGACIAATTHYAELKAYAIHTDGVENGSCEFDVATLRPTYRLLVGIPGRSNAFAISERLGMSAEVVNRARELVSGDDRQLEEVVSQLDAQRQKLEAEIRETQQNRAEAEAVARKAEQKLSDVQATRDKEIEAAKAEARRILERARYEAEQLMDEVDVVRKKKIAAESSSELLSAKSSLKSKLRQAENAIDPVKKAQNELYVLPRPLKIGDEVRIADIDKVATVLSLPDSSNNVEIQAGIIKTRVALSRLRLVRKQSASPVYTATPKPRTNRGQTISRVERSADTEVDLRGMMAEEGILEVDRFIDNAVMAGLETVTIIHGKGTGALRKAIQQHLRTHPSVKAFRLGQYGEGESGVTIVTLK